MKKVGKLINNFNFNLAYKLLKSDEHHLRYGLTRVIKLMDKFNKLSDIFEYIDELFHGDVLYRYGINVFPTKVHTLNVNNISILSAYTIPYYINHIQPKHIMMMLNAEYYDVIHLLMSKHNIPLHEYYFNFLVNNINRVLTDKNRYGGMIKDVVMYYNLGSQFYNPNTKVCYTDGKYRINTK